jgi:isopenicillin N synthase-like dioxygenase
MPLKRKQKPAKAKKPKLTRPHMPDSVKLQAALLQGIACGSGSGQILHKGEGQWDHAPALELRGYNPATKKYTPDANDPKYIRYMALKPHDVKTHGPGGTKRITAKGGDNHTAAHVGDLSASELAWRKRMEAKGKRVVPRRIT